MVAAHDVEALAIDDHVLLGGLRWSSSALAGDVTLCLGDHPPLRLDASLSDAARVTVTHAPRDPWSPAMSDSTDVFAALQVEVTVELASQSVSLETVASWGVGAVVEFPQRLGEVVVVRAGGQVVARGELDAHLDVQVPQHLAGIIHDRAPWAARRGGDGDARGVGDRGVEAQRRLRAEGERDVARQPAGRPAQAVQ